MSSMKAMKGELINNTLLLLLFWTKYCINNPVYDDYTFLNTIAVFL